MTLNKLKSESQKLIKDSMAGLRSFQNNTINDIDDYIIKFRSSSEYMWCEEEPSEEKLEEYRNKILGINTGALKEMCNVLEENYVAIFNKCKIHIQEYHYDIINFETIFESIKNREPLDYFCAITTLAFRADIDMEVVKYLNRMVKQKIASCKLEVLYEYLIVTKKVFVAISFNESMKKARNTIKDVLSNAGYLPIIIDEKEHNNSIVPEIFKEIEDSLFVVADITGHKNGVYYEAGYAKALKKQVIFSCKSIDFKKAHFDVNQINTICWKDEEDLKKRLSKRIECYNFDESYEI